MGFLSKSLLYASMFCLFSSVGFADISVVTLTGQVAPGTGNARFLSFSKASVNNFAEIAFHAGLSDGNEGIFKISHGQLSLVALSGQSIPESPGLTFGMMGDPVINDSGAIAFIAYIRSGQPQFPAVFVAIGSSITKILDSTTDIPNAVGNTISLMRNLQFNNRGDIAVHVTGDVGSGIVLVSNGVMPPAFFETTDISFSLNNLGDIACIGLDGAVYLLSGGMSQAIAQGGQLVQNTNLVLDTLQSPVLNDQRVVAFINGNAFYDGRLWYTVNNAVIQWHSGILEKVASDGDPVPGHEPAVLSAYFNEPLIDNMGRVFFLTKLSTNLNNALFRSDSGNLAVLVQEGRVLDGVGKFTFLGKPDSSDAGTVTFVSNLDSGSAGIFKLDESPYEILIPEVADGKYRDQWSWRTSIMLSNQDSSVPASALLTFIQDDGTPMDVTIESVTGSQFAIVVPPSGSLQLETNGLGSLKTGWARVQSNKRLSGISIYSFYDSAGDYVSEIGAPATSALNGFSLLVESTTETNTGIALANPNPSPSLTTLTLIDGQGVTLGSPMALTIPANGHIQRYLTEWFEDILPTDFFGTLEVVSQLPIIGMNLRQRQQQCTWLPLIF